MNKKVIELEIVDDLEQSGVSEIALVDVPAIERYWMAFKSESFVEPGAKESQDEFIGRCIEYVSNEGKDIDQAAAICYSKWQEHFDIIPNPCWSGYEPIGLKPNGDPNCVPIKNAKVTEADALNYKKQKFAETYSDYPEAAKNAAKRAIKYAEENGWGSCGTPVGKTRARQLANGEPLSEDTIARMAAFERHRQNSDTPYGEGCGKLMWDAWGGDAGVEWASRKLQQIRNQKTELSYDVSALPAYVDTGVTRKKKDNQYELLGIPLPRGQKVVLQAEDLDYNRGLIVELKEDGGYDVQYWFETPDNIEPAEIRVDGELITNSGNTVFLGYHPEIDKVEMSKLFFASEDQQIVVGPAMVPDMEILRKDEDTGEPYFVKFSTDVIKRIAEKFMRELRNRDTNIQHDPTKDAGSYVMETWIVENEEDKANSLYNMKVPVGTWMVKMRVEDSSTWKKIKSGELRGFSIEGNFMSKEDYLTYQKDKALYNRVIKILKSLE
jgi:hypothetical protein